MDNKDIDIKHNLVVINHKISKLEIEKAKIITTTARKKIIDKEIKLLREEASNYFKERKQEYPKWMRN